MRARVPIPVSRRPVARHLRWGPAVAAAGLAVALAACGEDDGGADLPAVQGPTSPKREVSATEMAYEPDAVAVDAGDVEVVLHNEGSTLHDLRIEDEELVVEAMSGETGTGEISLEPGRYQFFCSISGHREAGMEGVLEVR
jgi:plastocyanin